MPIPPANLYPPFNIVRLSHVELNVTDLAWSRGFYVDTLGLQVSHEDASHIYLRALEELSGCPLAIVSTGPDRDHTMVLQDPFA